MPSRCHIPIVVVASFVLIACGDSSSAPDDAPDGGGTSGKDGGGGRGSGGSGGSGDSGGNVGPVTVAPADSHRRVAAVYRASVVIDSDGHLHAWGNNQLGALGQDDDQAGRALTTAALALAPTTVAGAGSTETFVSVAGGMDHFLALTESGDLYGWGGNNDGQLDDTGVPVLVPTLLMSDVVAMDASANRCVALDADNKIWIWGRDYGPTPVEQDTPSDVEFAAVAQSGNHTLALTVDGQVYGWGSNNAGQLGNGGTPSNITEPTLLMGEDGTTPLSGIVAVHAGENSSAALDADGTLWTWGQNTRGQLGDGTMDNRNLPGPVDSNAKFVSFAMDHQRMYAIDDEGTTWAWGNAEGERLGAPAADCGGNCATSPVALTGADDIVLTQIGVGREHAVALDEDGIFYGWGANSQGYVGNGTPGDPETITQVQGFMGRKVTDIFAEHAGDSPRVMFLLDDDSLWGFGRHGNISGTFTEGIWPAHVTGLADKTIVDYCTGARFSLALDDAGTVYAIGEYTDALGQGDGGPASTTEWLPVPFPGGSVVIEDIDCGPDTSFALDDTGGLWSWGHGASGELGQGLAAPASVNEPGRVLGLEGVGTLDNVIAFRAGSASSARDQVIAILQGGQVATWGAEISGSLGRAPAHTCTASAFDCSRHPRLVCAAGVVDRGDCDDGAGPQYLAGVSKVSTPNGGCLALAGSTVWAWGSDARGLTGQGTENVAQLVPIAVAGITGTPIDVFGGTTYDLVLTDEGDVWSWGTNNHGQLGLGANDDMNCSSGASCAMVPTKVAGLDAVNVVKLAAGNEHVAALDDQGRIWTWGSNGSGELGNNAADVFGGGHYGGLAPRRVTLIPE